MEKDKLIRASDLKNWIKTWEYKVKYYHPDEECTSIPLSELADIIDQMKGSEAIPVEFIEESIRGYATEEPYDMHAVGVLYWLIEWWRKWSD